MSIRLGSRRLWSKKKQQGVLFYRKATLRVFGQVHAFEPIWCYVNQYVTVPWKLYHERTFHTLFMMAHSYIKHCKTWYASPKEFKWESPWEWNARIENRSTASSQLKHCEAINYWNQFGVILVGVYMMLSWPHGYIHLGSRTWMRGSSRSLRFLLHASIEGVVLFGRVRYLRELVSQYCSRSGWS